MIELDEKEKEKKPVAEEEKIKDEAEELPEKEEKMEEETKEPPEMEEEKEPAFIYEEKKKSKGYLWLLLLLIPVALFLIWFFLLRDGKPETEVTEVTATTQPEAIAEEGEEAVESQPEVVPEETMAEEAVTQPAVTGGKKFYVVAGCFTIEENADKYVVLLRNKGYDSEKFGMVGRFHAVSFHSYSSRNEAIRKLNEIRETVEPTAWLLYY